MTARISADGWLTIEATSKEEIAQLWDFVVTTNPPKGKKPKISVLSGFSSSHGQITIVPEKL